MLKTVSFALCCINLSIISSEIASEHFSSEENPFTIPPDWTDIITSLDNFQGSFKNKQDKFSNLLNILKTALCEELETVTCNNIEENNQGPVIINCVEEKNTKIYNISKTVEKDGKNITKKELKEIIAGMASTADKSKCTTRDNQPNVDIPAMIPIFKPKNENCATKSDSNKCGKETKGNMSPNTNTPAFTIPCQRTSDILDGSYLIPKVTYETSKINISPNEQSVKTNLQCEKPNSSLTTKSISCVESDDVIAMLFKPKTISMMQVYGNLLKKITMTVLVPFYVSKFVL